VEFADPVTGDLQTAVAPACPSKGVIGEGQPHCVDYRASKRDNAGDLNLVLLFFEDPRVTIPAG
jgi:hypothetical protein